MSYLLSNTMPELTEQELLFWGTHTVSYFEPAVKQYVSAKYCSYACFFHHAGIADAKRKEQVRGIVGDKGSYAIRNKETGKRASIYR